MQATWTPYFYQLLPLILEEIKTYVEMETPSNNKMAVDHLGGYITRQFKDLGCQVTVIEQKEFGNQLKIEYGSGEEQVMVLGHFDTVKDVGTLDKEPWYIKNGKAYGPGIYDMKAGIVFTYFALKTLIKEDLHTKHKLVFLWNTDEEVGSPSSREMICEEAKKSKAVLVVEPAHGTGKLKTSRKGGGNFVIKVFGRAAHAGNEHHVGVNAIVELSQHLPMIQSWTNYDEGTTLSVGLIRGGSASNVVPDYAEATVDVRISKTLEAKKITDRFKQLHPFELGARIEIEGGIDIPPMEFTTKTEELFLLAKREAEVEGFKIEGIAVGGTSDGNLTSSVGTPTLDGLGPIGDGAHAIHEHIDIESIPSRIALLLRMFCSI